MNSGSHSQGKALSSWCGLTRALLLAALLLGGILAEVRAEYVRFTYIPGGVEPPKNPPAGAAPVVPAPPPGNPGVPGKPQGAPGSEAPSVRADVVVEISKINASPFGPGSFEVIHRWGKTNLIQTPEIGWTQVKDNNKGIPTVLKKYQDFREKKNRQKAEDLLVLVEHGLSHGMLTQALNGPGMAKEFDQDRKELLSIKSTNPRVRTFQAVDKELDRKISLDDPVDWGSRLAGYKVDRDTFHYTILFPSRVGPPELNSLKFRLENNLRTFYYWFALKGKALPMPRQRLTVVLVDKPEEFAALHAVFDSRPLSADAVYSRRDNVAVFCATFLDGAYNSLSTATRPLWLQGWNKQALLLGQIDPRFQPNQVAHAQQVALVLKAMEEELELAAVSQAGSQQLVVGAGLLPRAVVAPDWIEFGMGSFFETPKGAYWPGTGAPHWSFLIHFQLMRDAKSLDKAEDALWGVVSDRYFRHAKASNAPEALLKARTLSWSLTYFLAQRRLDGLLRYFQELSNMPRDLDLDETALIGCFARAFDLTDKSKPNELNPTQVRELSQKWYESMNDIHIEVPEVLTLTKERMQGK